MSHEQPSPPAGGFGSGPVSTSFGPALADDTPRAPRNLRPLVTVGVILVSLSSVTVLVVAGCRRYIELAKTAEVRNELKTIAALAASSYEDKHHLCASASQGVPAKVEDIVPARKYQSSTRDWHADDERDAGFACLGYEMRSVQHYQYRYSATGTAFTASGRGDLDGNGTLSDFVWTGRVEGGHVVVAPKILERNDEL